MKYQLICTENNRTIAEAKRSNDSFLIQEVRSILAGGWFNDGTCKLFMDGEEIDPEIILDRDDERYERWLEKKKQTHKLISVSTGMCCYSQNNRKIWVPK